MAEKFVGAEIRAGQFTDKTTGNVIAYNNLMFQCANESPNKVGFICNDICKIKNTGSELVRVFGEPISLKWLKDRLGWWCDIFYDKPRGFSSTSNPKVSRIVFYGPDKPGDPDSIPTAAEGIVDIEGGVE